MSVLPDPAPLSGAGMPSGTVSFAFTDIEGSTSRWDADRTAMQDAVRRHDAIMRAAIVQANGYIFKTIGDAFCAAFRCPEDALVAMVAAQRALAAQDFSAVNDIRVRAAIHTGTADERDGDYFGPVVNRVARLVGIGHGGQILLSGATRALMHGLLPPETTLHDLGQHRLKDLTASEHVFELVVAGLAQAHPPLRSVDAHPNNLPTAPTTFIGRESEVAELTELLVTHRMVTLVGAGGIGKTRTSLQVAANFSAAFDDGVWFIELAPLSNGEYLAAALAQALSVTLSADGDPIEKLVQSLASKKALLVFDNCEHIIDAAARLCAAIVRRCAHVKIMTSSRQALGIGGERTYRLPSLAVPALVQGDAMSAHVAGQSAAIALFVDRARAADPRFSLTDANAATVAEICRRLDGIALAIELAAARVKILSPRQLRDRLDERFRVLTGGSRDVLPRQQTLRALIDWSYDLLEERERALFRRLSVFVDGFTLEAAVDVAGGDDLDEFEVIDVLTSLVDKSLVLAESAGESSRYTMLESTRAYALERLRAAGEAGSIARRHAHYFAAFAGDPVAHSGSIAAGLAATAGELDNLRATLTWALQERNDVLLGAHVAYVLGRFWSTRLPREGQHWLERAQRELETGSDPVLAAKIASAIAAMLPHGTFERIAATERALQAARLALDQHVLVKALCAYGEQLAPLGRSAEARVAFEEASACARELGSDWDAARALAGLAALAVDREDIAAARELGTRAIGLFEALGAIDGVAYVCITLGEAEYSAGNLETATSLICRARTAHGQLNNARSSACAANLLGALSLAGGQSGDARAHARDALELLRYDRHPMFFNGALELLAHVATLEGDTSRGSLLQGYTQAAIGRLAHARSRPAQWSYERHLEQLTRALGLDECALRAATGAQLSEDQALAEALAV